MEMQGERGSKFVQDAHSARRACGSAVLAWPFELMLPGMGLEVIGAGWGRTGTESLKAALEMLGFGRCYHMFELLARTRHVRHWKAL